LSEESESVGSVAEETAKLLGVLKDWAVQNPGAPTSAMSGVASALLSLDDHIATDGEDCRYCPLCHLISTVRQMSPEVKHHLSAVASSLLAAAAEAVTPEKSPRGRSGQGPPVQKIDLNEPWDDD
jgi:hypothetical protein